MLARLVAALPGNDHGFSGLNARYDFDPVIAFNPGDHRTVLHLVGTIHNQQMSFVAVTKHRLSRDIQSGAVLLQIDLCFSEHAGTQSQDQDCERQLPPSWCAYSCQARE